MAITQNTGNSKTGPSFPDRVTGIGWSTHRKLLIGLIAVVSILLLIPVWSVRYPPLIDYPNHLASAFVLAHLKDPAFHFSRFYGASWRPTPYLTMELILVGLERLLPAAAAGCVLLSLSLLAVPAAVWFFIRQANPGEESLAYWGLLLASNMYFFLYGFINLQLAFALCFVVLGLWLRYLRKPSPGLWWLLLAVVTALYFTHLMGFGVAGLAVAAYLLLNRRSAGEILRSGLLFVPAAVFYLLWSNHRHGHWTMLFQGLAWKAKGLLAVMIGYSPALDFLTLLVMGGCILWAVSDNPELGWNRSWLGTLAILFAVYLLLPSNYGTATVVDRRMLPFLFVIALAGVKVGKRATLMVPVVLLLFVLRTGSVERNFLSIQPHLETLAQSFSVVPKNSCILPFVVHQSENPLPEDHFWAYGVIQRDWFSPYLFHDPGVHALQVKLQTYTPSYGPEYLATNPKTIKWKQIGQDYDYVWAYHAQAYSRQLRKIGKLVFNTEGLQVFQLNRLK